MTGRRAKPLVPVMRAEPMALPEGPDIELHARDKWAYPVNPMAVGMDWGRRGFSCDQVIDPPGADSGEIEHETNELIAVLSGRLEILVELESGTELVDALPGDEVYIVQGTRHTVRNPHGHETRWLYGFDEGGFGI